MVRFSSNARLADEQIHAILFYLTSFGYIDGNFDASEKDFIVDYIRDVVPQRVAAAGTRPTDPEYRAVAEQFQRRYVRQFEKIDTQVRDILQEAVGAGDDRRHYATDKLKVRCFEIFQGFDQDNQRLLMDTVDELIAADGVVHPSEQRFRDELMSLLQVELPDEEPPPPPAPRRTVIVEDEEEEGADWSFTTAQTRTATVSTGPPTGLQLKPPVQLSPRESNHPFFERLEHHYSKDRERLAYQSSRDLQTVQRALDRLSTQRAGGLGKLYGKKSMADLLAEREPFLDERVYVVPPQKGKRYELTVLGDLHGCYGCLKAALLQADFVRKVEAYRTDPRRNPEPKLILLGDYIDRGRLGFEGVLRASLELFTMMPDHVYLLRGNHEYYLEKNGRVFSGVAPAEAYALMAPYWPVEQFQAYRKLFDEMPVALLFDDLFFVHGGIPRDDSLNPVWRDLSSLNEEKLAFEMLWSDPSDADFIPSDLQASNTRFAFGRVQFRNFMRRVGAKTLIRGHEKITQGLHINYDFEGLRLFTLFSAGGRYNHDLPEESSYREVTPMAVTIEWNDGVQSFTPWPIDWALFNTGERNNFHRSPPELNLPI